MKATELIHKGLYKLGDKYILFNALNGFVYEILDGGYGKCLGDVYEDTENNALGVALSEDSWEEIQPITLTEEILKANGFIDQNATNGLNFRWYVLQVNQEYGDVWGRTNHEITVAWREVNSDVYINRPYGTSSQQKIGVADIRYVHELQHALRLCGLNDLADSFQV